MIRKLLIIMSIILSGCATLPPTDVNNICSIFAEKDGWYDDAADSADKWGSPIPLMMAFMHQESRFQAKVKPPRRKILWVIPGPRLSSSYGYSQAKVETWDWYKRDGGNYGADRDDFADAVDFVGWYNHQSYRTNGISKDDTYHLYLAYHEGHGGFKRRSFRDKQCLKDIARMVSRRAFSYRKQLVGCEQELKDNGWFFGLI